ncbi:MAG: 30S ribosomal protein S20 [Geminicoccaceae bacterium]|nr:30S ribosomal protein S20 [Geminicoccaceae bacterium]MDW8340346.1 30S ribosomal protein S20 [Geminicoccaceae bacterium]
MANTASARKRVRQTIKRTLRNKARKSRIKTFIRKVEAALAAGDPVAAREAFKAAEPEIRRGVSKGVLHLNTASRKISRLAQRIKALDLAKARAREGASA